MGTREVVTAGVLAVFVLAFAPCWADGTVWYVDKANTSGTETGKSWGEAFRAIQPAIDAAHADGGGEVWVAKGTYDEPRQFIQDDMNTGALALKSGVAVYGGFTGKEKRREQRDWEKNETAISGEKSRDGERAFHAVVGANKSRLDGFEITGAHTFGEKGPGVLRAGGGIMCWGVNMTIANCAVVNNTSDGAAGGIYCNNSNVTIENCRIEDNASLGKNTGGGGIVLVECADSRIIGCRIARNRSVTRGGGLYCFRSSPTVTDTHFEDNECPRGGGLAAYTMSSPVLTGCTFEGNKGALGGAIRIGHHCNPKMRDCTISGNSSTGGGGGISLWRASSLEMTRCELTENKGAKYGGGISVAEASLVMTDCSLSRNTSDSGGGLFFFGKVNALLANCTFDANRPYAITLGTGKSELAVTATRFKNVQKGILLDQGTKHSFLTVAELNATRDNWTNNVQDNEPLVMAEAGNGAGGSLGGIDFPEEPEENAIEVTTADSKVLIKGQTAVLAVFVAALMVLLVGAGVYFLSRGIGPAKKPPPEASSVIDEILVASQKESKEEQGKRDESVE